MTEKIITPEEYIALSGRKRSALLRRLGDVAQEEVAFLRGDTSHPDSAAMRQSWTMEDEGILVARFLHDTAVFRQAVGIEG